MNTAYVFLPLTSEIPLCGHATLSSAHIMFETGIVKKDETITFSSKAGILKIRYSDGWIIMNFPAYDLVAAEVPQDLCNYNVITPLEYYRCQLLSQVFPGQVYAFTENIAIRTGKIDILKYTKSILAFSKRLYRFNSILVNKNNLAGLNIPDIFGIN